MKSKKLILLIKIIASLMLIVGVGFLLFPPASNMYGGIVAKSEIQRFDDASSNIVQDESKTYRQAYDDGDIDKEGYPIDESGNRTSSVPFRYKLDIDRLKADSIKYNERLRKEQSLLLTSSYAYSKPSLDLREYGIYDGMYGYVSADSIGMKLPIYLGASNANMSYGAAHLTYTSLPVGEKTSNVVLAGHTGYIGRIFFDNIRSLKKDDIITVTNYWTRLNYKVVETEVHTPSDSQKIFINDDRDLLTLITCISDGNGGFNRYYVICERK